MLKFVREDLLENEELCVVAVNKHGLSLFDIPESLRTRKICLAAFLSDHNVISGIPTEYIAPGMYERAVQKNGLCLKCVPEEYKTKALCQDAVASTGSALEYVPDHLKDYQLCFDAIKSFLSAIQYVPSNILEKHPDLLQYVRENINNVHDFDRGNWMNKYNTPS
jgi:hypothetical protein